MKKPRTIKIYKTYRFRDKDPIIDEVRTALADSGTSERVACELSGVSRSTPANWFRGDTRRPSITTINAFCRAFDHKIKIVSMRNGKENK